MEKTHESISAYQRNVILVSANIYRKKKLKNTKEITRATTDLDARECPIIRPYYGLPLFHTNRSSV